MNLSVLPSRVHGTTRAYCKSQGEWHRALGMLVRPRPGGRRNATFNLPMKIISAPHRGKGQNGKDEAGHSLSGPWILTAVGSILDNTNIRTGNRFMVHEQFT